jgi:tRNA U34 5-methylaminomethyl-2-thiouridine-forming methyltransferase MnmC
MAENKSTVADVVTAAISGGATAATTAAAGITRSRLSAAAATVPARVLSVEA